MSLNRIARWVVLVGLFTVNLPVTGEWSAVSAAPAAALYVSVAGNDGNSCLSIPTACRTITGAIGKANAGDTIHVGPGTFDAGAGEVFPLALLPRVSLVGAGSGGTIVSGDPDQDVLYLEADATPILSDTVISGLTLSGGERGLYIHAEQNRVASPALIDLRVSNNRLGLHLSTHDDVYMPGATVSPWISNTQVLSNTEVGVVLEAYMYNGDGCWVEPVLNDVTIAGNGSHGLVMQASSAGNAYCAAAPTILDGRITGNGGHGLETSVAGYGRALPRLEGSYVLDNGGVGLHWGSENVGFAGEPPRAAMTNTTIARNGAGGIQLANGHGYLVIVNSTLADNADFGIRRENGAYPQVRVTVLNSILWNEGADDLAGVPLTGASGIMGSAPFDFVSYSIIEDGDLMGQDGNLAADPLLLGDYHLSDCSGAMNAGTAEGAPLTDIDGELRPAGSAVDIGADEHEAACWLMAGKQVTPAEAQVGGLLTYYVTLTNTTVVTPLQFSLVDLLPMALDFQADSLTASHGTAGYYAQGISWTATISPGEVVSLTYAAQVRFGDTSIINRAQIETNIGGTYVARHMVQVPPVRSYLPAIVRPIPGIQGYVLENGEPANNIYVELRFFDGSSWSTVDGRFTFLGGWYLFDNAPGLAPGQRYYIRYQNTTNNTNRLTTWHTPEITSYSAGGTVGLPTFDVANIGLVSPAPGAAVALPATFTWNKRGATPSDQYEFNLFEPNTGSPYFFTQPPLGYVDSFTLNSLPGGFSPDVWYVWDLWVYGPSGGFGVSYYAYYIRFSSAGLEIIRTEAAPLDTAARGVDLPVTPRIVP